MQGIVAITGASGFLGRAISSRLARAGWQVRAITRGAASVPGARQIVAAGDLASAPLPPLLEGCSAVIHCAARLHLRRGESSAAAEAAFLAANRDLTLRLAEAARAAGVARFVFASSAAAIASASQPGELVDEQTAPRPATAYGRSKLAAEQALAGLAQPGFSILALRPPVIFGPGAGGWFARLARAARLGLPLPLGAISNRRSFSYVGNVADGFAAALSGEAEGAFFLVDSPPLATGTLYRAMLAHYGHGDRVWHWPETVVRAGARIVLGRRSASLVGDAAFSGAAFAAAFSWQPPFTFAQALAQTLSSAVPPPAGW